MKVFVPQACAVIDRLSKDGTAKNEKIDEELKFNILILSEVSTVAVQKPDLFCIQTTTLNVRIQNVRFGKLN